MKTFKALALMAVLAVMMFSTTACETPAYTSQERFGRIGRNWGWEYEQINDDIDTLFLLRPAGHLSQWNLQ